METISLAHARSIILQAQGLAPGRQFAPGKQGALQVIRQLGYVQIDSIAVINRAHHQTLWTRVPGYQLGQVEELQTDGSVFEYWRGSAASYLPVQDYRYYRPHMEAYAASERYHGWLTANRGLADDVLQRITHDGALTSAQFEALESFQGGGWWNRKPAKIALEQLFSAGYLMVSARRNFARAYDLTERVLPAGTKTSPVNLVEMAHFAVERALRANGVIAADESGWHHADPALTQQALNELVEVGIAVPVHIADLEGEYYLEAQALNSVTKSAPSGLHLLAPFDNLVISRSRLERLFGYVFHLECYLPAHKRQVGYYCLPVLWGDRFAARLDPKADRKTKTFIVHQVQAEEAIDVDTLAEPLAHTLVELASFNGCERVHLERSVPASLGEQVRRQLGYLQP